MPLEPLELPYGLNTLCYTGQGSSVGQIWGRWKRNRQYFLFFAAYSGCPGRRPEMQLLNGLSPSCSVLACCPEVGATWSIWKVRPALARL